MSGSTGTPRHPDDDLLADLAADVLPVDAARQVEAHVMGCARCADVLSSAEGVRGLLRQLRPDPMPADVMARLDQAMAAVVAGRELPARRRRARATPADPADPAAGRPSDGPRGRPVDRPVGPSVDRPVGQPVDRSGPATSSYQVRPLNLPAERPSGHPSGGSVDGRGAAPGGRFPAGDPTSMQPVVQGNDPELTQPVRPRRATRPEAGADPDRARRAAGPETSSLTGRLRIGAGQQQPAKLNRMDSTQAIRVRRQALEEQRADEPSRWPRISPKIAAAVLLVLVLAGGVTTWALRGGGLPGSGSGSASSSAGVAGVVRSGPLLVSVQETGTNYSKSGLAGQVDQLVKTGNRALDTPSDASTFGMQDRSQDKSPASGVPSAAGSSSADLLRSPAALQACLRAIDEGDAQPVAVDLATYDDQEAAIIVLPGVSGGYDVWVVARTCRPGDDGTIAVDKVAS